MSEENKKKRWIKSGISVASITDLDTIMTVEKIVYKSAKFGDKTVSKIIGVKCYFFDGKTKITREVHSKELIPLNVVLQGKIECYKFINREGDYKEY